MRPAIFPCLLLFLFLCLACPIKATETLYLKNGDKISGTQIGFGEGVLKWKWRDHEQIEVPFDEIEKVDYSPDPAHHEDEFGNLVLLPPGQVFAPPADHVPLDLPPPPPPKPPLLATLWHEYNDWFQHGFGSWTERLEVGGTFLEGNTNQDAFNTAAKFSHETDWTKTVINLGGQYAQSKSVMTANRWFGDTTTDFKRKDNWLTFIRTLHEFDEFANLDYRGTFSAGAGYKFVNTDTKQFILRAGPGFTQEVFHNPRTLRSTPDLFTELEAKWPLGERVVFEEKITTHPSIVNWELVRILNTTNFLIPLDSHKRWNLKVGFRYEYNGIPNINRRPSDFATTLNIVYTKQ